MKYDENFEKIMEYTFKSEGGFSNRKNDLGGRTNLGVTQNTYDAWRKKKGLPQKDVLNITKDEAKQLYYEEFWKPTGASEKQDLREGYLLFDMAVNSGPYQAKKLFNKSDGNIYQFLKDRKDFYSDIIRKKPSQKEFEQGWTNRLHDIENNMNELVNKGYYKPPYKNEKTPYDKDFDNPNLKQPSDFKNYTDEQIQNIKNKYQYLKNKNSPTGFAADHIFTPSEIGSMSDEDFEHHEHTISQQATRGLIQPQSHQRKDFSGWKNPLNNDNRIFTRESIGEMSDNEFETYEKAIGAQLAKIGIPTNHEMQNSFGAVYVAPYTRADGVQVKGYYRSR